MKGHLLTVLIMRRVSVSMSTIVLLSVISIFFHGDVIAVDSCPSSSITEDSKWGMDLMVGGKYDCSETDLVVDGATLLVEVPFGVDFVGDVVVVDSLSYQDGGNIKVVVYETVYKEVLPFSDQLRKPTTIGNLASTGVLLGQVISFGALLTLNKLSMASFITVLSNVFLGKKYLRNLWGVVFDAKTKEPIPFAVVRLFNVASKRLIHTSVTDLDGRYGFPPQIGKYFIRVRHEEYVFPSKVSSLKYDKVEKSIYLGEDIHLTEESSVDFLIPLDRKDLKINMSYEMFKMILSKLKRLFTQGNIYLMILMIGMNFLLLLNEFSFITLGFGVLYLLMLLLQIFSKTKKPKAWGTVYDAKAKNPVNMAFVKLYSANGKMVIDTTLSDAKGRFQFFVPSGEYLLLVGAQGYRFPSKVIPDSSLGFLKGLMKVSAVQGILNIDVPVDMEVRGLQGSI